MAFKTIRFIQKIPSSFQKKRNTLYLAIVGSREVSDRAFVNECVDKVLGLFTYRNLVIVSGGARGVDTIAREIAEELFCPIIEILPDWKRLGKIAGIERNKEIVKIADVVVAIPSSNSRGTIHTIQHSLNNKKLTFVFPYNNDPRLIELSQKARKLLMELALDSDRKSVRKRKKHIKK